MLSVLWFGVSGLSVMVCWQGIIVTQVRVQGAEYRASPKTGVSPG